MAYAALETPSGLCYIRGPVAYADSRSKAVISGVVHSMFMVSSIVCVFCVYGPYLVKLCSSQFAISFHRNRESLALL